MEQIMDNLEHEIVVNCNKPNIRSADLRKIDNAWATGDYRIWVEEYDDVDGLELVISASRRCRNLGINITREWKEVMKHLENNIIPQWLKEKTFKKIIDEGVIFEAPDGQEMQEDTNLKDVNSNERMDNEVRKNTTVEANRYLEQKKKEQAEVNKESVQTDEEVNADNEAGANVEENMSSTNTMLEMKNVLENDFIISVPESISRENKCNMFTTNDTLKEYVKKRLGTKAFFKMWPELDTRGMVNIRYQFKGSGAKELVQGIIQRRQLIGKRTAFEFLKNYKNVDETIVRALYHVVNEILDKLDEVSVITDDAMGFEETYARTVWQVNKIICNKNTDELIKDYKNVSIDGQEFICIRGKDALIKILKEIDSTIKGCEFLRELRDPEEGNSFLLIDDGRNYDHRGKNDCGHWWYYIRIEKSIMEKYFEKGDEVQWF